MARPMPFPAPVTKATSRAGSKGLSSTLMLVAHSRGDCTNCNLFQAWRTYLGLAKFEGLLVRFGSPGSVDTEGDQHERGCHEYLLRSKDSFQHDQLAKPLG